MKRWLFLFACLLLAACSETETREREIGYKGKARVNPYLALERFVAIYSGEEMQVRDAWKNPTWDDAVMILSVETLTSTKLVSNLQEWVEDGGHAIFLLENAEMSRNDWSEHHAPVKVPVALREFFNLVEITVTEEDTPKKYTSVQLADESWKIELESYHGVEVEGEPATAIAHLAWGDGAITVINDARLLRNRMIDQAEHADVCALLLDESREGHVVFQREYGLTFFSMLWNRAWMVLVALGLILLLWLFRHMPRFGPVDADVPDRVLRAYDHHLEMIGDYHWRMDRGVTLLQPLRQEVQELCHHWQVKTGRLDEGLFELMAAQTGLTFERVQRAMTEWKPSDSVVFARAVSDLQQIRKAFL